MRDDVKPSYYAFQAATGGSMAEYHRRYGTDRALTPSETAAKTSADTTRTNPRIGSGRTSIGTDDATWASRFPTSATAVRIGDTPLKNASPQVQDYFKTNPIELPPQVDTTPPLSLSLNPAGNDFTGSLAASPFPTPTPRIITPPPVATPPPPTLPPVTRPPAQRIAGGATFTQSAAGNAISAGQYGPGGFSTFGTPAADVAPHVAMMDAASNMMDGYPWHDDTNRPEYA